MLSGYQITHNHVKLNTQTGQYSLEGEGYVVGLSIEVTDQSLDTVMLYGINENPKIQVNQGDAAREYGGFEVAGVPCYYTGYIKWSFNTNLGPDGILIVSTLVPVPRSIDKP